jgi:UDP-glucose 4-epimerase
LAVLVTGGAGFIGTHTCAELLSHGYDLVVADDYSNSFPGALDAVRELAGRPASQPIAVRRLDLRDHAALDRLFGDYDIGAVIHFAAKKAIAESLRMPVDYYDINVAGTTNLLRVMAGHQVTRLVYSSSCSIFGEGHRGAIGEDDPMRPTNPYSRSKLMTEEILADTCRRYPEFSAVVLRYFNPAGAHPSGRLGEVPRGIPNNVMPYLMRVAAGQLERLTIYGDDYDTPDGSAIRDYIHVADLADAHRVALAHAGDQPGVQAFNLGTGTGASVLELVDTFRETCGVDVPVTMAGRRPGDVATLVADPARIEKQWGWRTTRDLADMCRDAWRFQQLNPAGYPSQPEWS